MSSLQLESRQGIPNSIRRVARECLNNSLELLGTRPNVLNDEEIHETRRNLKKLRAVLLLVKPEIGEKRFKREDRSLRRAARPLGIVRDSAVIAEVFQHLLKNLEGGSNPAPLEELRVALAERHRVLGYQLIEADQAGRRLALALKREKKRSKDWSLHRKGWKALRPGILDTYRRAFRAMKRARVEFADGALHEWRKRTKELRYVLELLQTANPGPIGSLAADAHRLTNLLGDDHDLAVLQETLGQMCANQSIEASAAVVTLIESRRHRLQLEAVGLGSQLFQLSPTKFVGRLERLWRDAPRMGLPSRIQPSSNRRRHLRPSRPS